MYFDTSADILNIILALAILWLTILLSWFLFYAISIVRGIREAVAEVQERIRALDQVLHLIREKLESTSTYLGLLVDVVKEGISWYRDRGDHAPFTVKKVQAKKKT